MTNLLPYDGTVNYYKDVFKDEHSTNYIQILLENIQWRNDQAFLFGRHHVLKRKAAWYGDKFFEYKYAGTVKTALQWTPELLEIKTCVERLTGHSYNSCLLNLYESGSEGMSWHSDNEKTMEEGSAIASVSFGAARTFYFKHKTDQIKVQVNLENGSILLMLGSTQKHWLHSLPKSKKVLDLRINLTFRTFIEK